MMTQVPHWNGSEVTSADLETEFLGSTVKRRLLAQVVRMYEANARQGTVRTKTRADVASTGRKPYRQKGTGNARRGDFSSPILRGGGTIFGPKPRDYSYSIPRKALREALRSALLGKVQDDEVATMTAPELAEPSTKAAASFVRGLECLSSTVIVAPGDDRTLVLSCRNLPRVSVVRAQDLNAYDVLSHNKVICVANAWEIVKERLAHQEEEVQA